MPRQGTKTPKVWQGREGNIWEEYGRGSGTRDRTVAFYDAWKAQGLSGNEAMAIVDAQSKDRGNRSDYTNALKAFEELFRDTSNDSTSSRSSGSSSSGSSSSSSRSSSSSSSGSGGGSNNADGFLWKPVSESDRNLVVLMPEGTNDSSLTIKDAQGNVIETAQRTGTYQDGRPLYRFSKPGASYGNNVTVGGQSIAYGSGRNGVQGATGSGGGGDFAGGTNRFGLQSTLDNIDKLELNRFTRDPNTQLSDEQRQLIKQVAGMTEEGSTFDKMLKGEVDFGRAERIFNMQRNNMRNQFIPMVEGQMARSGNLNSGSMQRATERMVGEQSGREAETMFKMDQAALDRSIQAGSLLPLISGVLDMPRKNEIANIERDFQIHFANQGLSVQEFGSEISLLKEAEAIAKLDIDAFQSESQAEFWMGQLAHMSEELEFNKMKFAAEQEAARKAAKASKLGAILGTVGMIAGNFLLPGSGPLLGAALGSIGTGVGKAAGGDWAGAAGEVGNFSQTMIAESVLSERYPGLSFDDSILDRNRGSSEALFNQPAPAWNVPGAAWGSQVEPGGRDMRMTNAGVDMNRQIEREILADMERDATNLQISGGFNPSHGIGMQ